MRQCGIDGRAVDANAHLSGTSMRLGKLAMCKTSGPPNVVMPIAFFIIVSSLPLALPGTQELRREDGVPRERSLWPGWQRHSTPGEPGVVQQWRQPCAMAALPLVGR